MQIKFQELKLQNFKSHRDLQVNFGEVTKISGDNAKGKSSILEALSWTLYGTDMVGSKLDPSPVTYQADETLVELLLEVDGKQLFLGRGVKKGKAHYIINDVPSKATEYTALVDQLGEKDFLLSLINPFYFFSMKWEKQRSMVLQYVAAPSNKEVFKQLPDLQADKLAELVKKHSLDDLKKIHSANKTKMEKDHIAAQSKTKTLLEQLNNLTSSDIDVQEVEKELDALSDQIAEVEKTINGAIKVNDAFYAKQSEIKALQHQIDLSKDRWPLLKNEVIEDTCKTCKRPLDDDSVKAVEDDKAQRISEYKTNHKKLTDRKAEFLEELSKIEYIDVSEQHEKIRELENKKHPLILSVSTHSQREKLLTQIEEAKRDEEYKLSSLKESIFTIDAIKDFNAKEAELQGEKVQALFETLSIRLFDELKTTGELKATFEIEMDGKGYSKLSLSESIRAGLELREVLSKQSEVIAPVFIDNSESITTFKEPSGQLIISRVVAGQELEVVSE